MLDPALRKQLIRWEVISVVWINLVGGFLHEVYRLTGYWTPIALIAPVNESIWEHMKMFFWPGLVIVLIQYLWMRRRVNDGLHNGLTDRVPNFWLAKLVLLTLSPLLSFITFAAYSEIAQSMGGRATVGVTGVLASLSAVVAQVVCARIIISDRISFSASRFIPAAYLLMIVAFSTLTYFPPRYYLFEHHDNYLPAGQYGLDADREQSGRARD